MTEARLTRLRKGLGCYRILALDHGLTVGFGGGAPRAPFAELIDACAPEISGVVLTYGMARSFANHHAVPVVLQCFGAPSGNQRVQIATLDEAIRLDAAAVSVQLDFSHPELSDRTRESSRLVSSAHGAGIPVLFMASGFDPEDVIAASNSVRICQELGADIIKIPCALTHLELPPDDLREVLTHSPPVLLAGGPYNSDIVAMATHALHAGFSGYCIGRSIFDAGNPHGVAQELAAVFSNCKSKEN